MALTFRLLGPVQIVSDGEMVTGIAPRHRAVLAYLLLHAGRVISLERLIDAMWGYDQPETARSQIHAAVTALRRALRTAGADGVLETRPGGYVAVPGSSRLDVREFDDLVSAGRFREALDLWHGEALADVHAGYAAGARALLDDRRLTAVERLMESQLEAGRHAAAVDELAGHVAANPLRERLAGQFVLALHRSGRQADALAAARAYRSALAEQQGLDPGSGFVELEKTVLAGAPSTGRPGFLPYDLPDFTGRAVELEAIRPGAPQNVVTIDGMAGVGKTTLAVRAAHRLADSFPDGQLFLDLRANTAGQAPVPAAAALEILLRQLGITDIPRAEQERSALWRAETRRRRVLVVIDNAADGAHVRPLLPGASDSLMLITSRRRLVDIDGARALSIDVLPADDAIALFGSIVGERAAAEPDAVREVLDLCGHLPLALRLAAARLQHRPRWTVAYLAGRLRPADLATAERSVTAAFTVSYEQLAEPEQRMFRLLGLAPGRDIEPQAAAALADLPVIDAEDLLEGLLDAHMLVQREPGRYTMHDLLREHARTLAADDDALMRLLVHYLHRSRSAVRQLYPGNIGDRPGLPPVLTPIEPLPGPDEAIGWLDAERGNIIATVVHGPRVCVGHLAHALRPYLDRQAHHDDAVTLHTIALTRGRANGDATVEGQALADLAWTHWRRGDYEQAQDFAGQALTVAADEFPRSLAMHALGDVAWRHRETERAETCLKEALDLARVAGDRSREGFVLGDLGMILDRLGRHDEARRHLDLALAMHRKDADPLGEARVLNQIGLLLRHQGRPGEALARHREAGDLYRAMGNRSDEAAAHNGLAEAALASGEPGQALTGHQAADALAGLAGNRPEQARARHGLARAHLARADWQPAADQALAAERLYRELGVPEAGDAQLLVLLARAQRAPDDDEPVRGAAEEEIERFAARYPMPLPQSYVSWLRVCNGAAAGPGGIYGLGEALERLGSFDGWPRQGRIPIASDGCGNAYVVDAKSGAVWFLDATDGDDYAYRVASDVQHFVRFLLERDAGQGGWPFDSRYVTGIDPAIRDTGDEALLPWNV
ncbi:BTAD domain-containing putative transcriptional regulator [Actinoplanes sp. NPDC026670]|uniref:BTAD domain-containing putative transcriptional regulator n=1 Tax=Actinoplanes sp. NPDC026670 TaxID=3154700 RepID=UPI0033EC7616